MKTMEIDFSRQVIEMTDASHSVKILARKVSLNIIEQTLCSR